MSQKLALEIISKNIKDQEFIKKVKALIEPKTSLQKLMDLYNSNPEKYDATRGTDVQQL